MNARNEKYWQFGPTAATLLVAYLLVLQGIAVGVASGARVASAGLFANSICLTRSEAPGGNPAAPSRSGHRFDICCVFHCSDLGAAPASAFAGEQAPIMAYADLRPAIDDHGVAIPAATPPLGSRAPPTGLL